MKLAEKITFWLLAAFLTALFLWLVGMLAARLVPAKAQSLAEGQAWIHVNGRDCCPHKNCFPVEIVVPAAPYWMVPGYVSDVRIGRERRWPFEKPYACAYPHDPSRVRCLFLPPAEAS